MRLTFLFLFVVNLIYSQSPYGEWYATLKAANLPLVFHIEKDGKRNQITVDSPKQQALKMPAEIVISSDHTLKVEMMNLDVSFEGV